MSAPLRFDRRALARRLRGLAGWKPGAFALALCERMLPNHRAFARATGGGSDALRGALDAAWSALVAGGAPPDAEAWIARCAAAAPDTEAHDHPLVSAALDAAGAVESLLRFLGDGDIGHVVEAASLARDTVDMAVEMPDTAGGSPAAREARTLGDPLVQRELRRQRDDLAWLAALDGDAASWIEELRGQWYDPPSGSLGVPDG